MPTDSIAAAREWKSSNIRERVERAEPGDPVDLPDYAAARAKRESEEAEIATMRRRKMAGELVERVEVERMAATLARLLRDRILGVPSRIAPTLAAAVGAFEVERILADELRSILGAIADAAEDVDHGRP